MGKTFGWKDKQTWPKDWPACEIEPYSQEAHHLATRLEHEYDAFIAYHACRTVDVSSYYREGLHTAQLSELVDQAIEIFAGGQFPEITGEEVVSAAQALARRDSGELYVTLDDRLLIEMYGHYLLYGSEYILSIAAELERRHGHSYRQYLKRFGTPTILVMELPFGWLTGEYREALAIYMSRYIRGEIEDKTEFTVGLDRSVPPEFVKSHYHPGIEIIWDKWAQ